jgi:hypothetical protein
LAVFPVRRVVVPEFELASNPKVLLSDVKRRTVAQRKCPVCGKDFFGSAFMEHVRSSPDYGHAVLEVMES